MTVGDIYVVRLGRPRIARIASLKPLGVQLAGYRSPPLRGAPGEFRPKWMAKVHQVAPEALLRPATRREVVLGQADLRISLTGSSGQATVGSMMNEFEDVAAAGTGSPHQGVPAAPAVMPASVASPSNRAAELFNDRRLEAAARAR